MYYEEDAKIMSDLAEEIEALGMPLVLFRKFNSIVGAITVQIEDEHTCPRVVDTLFNALEQLSEEIRQPERDTLLALASAGRQMVMQRLQKRDRTGKPAGP